MSKNFLTLFIFFIFSVFLSAQNAAPIAVIDFDTADINTPVNVIAPGVLSNDLDADGDALSVTEFTVDGTIYTAGQTVNFTQGQITINTNGSYIFIPNTGFTGNVNTIGYTITDGTFTHNSFLAFTVEETTDLLEIETIESCNQGYTVDNLYQIRYIIKLTNTSTARDYHTSSLITNIDLINDLEATFGIGCISDIDVSAVSTTSEAVVYGDIPPYPLDFNIESVNADYLDFTSTSFFSTDAINNLTLYPRQEIDISLCITIDPDCNGRPSPTPSGSGIDFENILEVTSSTGTDTNSLLLTDFHTTEAILAAGFYVPEIAPEVNPDGTFDYTNTVTLTNEGTVTANDINFNMGLGRFINDGVSFSELTIVSSDTSIIVNPNFDGDANSELLNPGNSLAPGETLILEIYALTDPISSANTYNFSQMPRSQTQGALDGFDETTNTRLLSFVSWSDGLGDHLDRYYPISSGTEFASSTSQCACTTTSMTLSFVASLSSSIISSSIEEPDGILEHQEVTFQITTTNISDAVQVENIQIQDDLNAICSGNIISVTAPTIESATATTNPTLNTSFNGITDINIFDGISGVLESGETITVEFTVLLSEDCPGFNVTNITATDPLNNTVNTSASTAVNAFTDTDEDGIPNGTDIDDDNDTIRDVDEYNGEDPLDDDDGDFIPNYRDTDFGADNNNDGIVDSFDFDNDGIPNHFDVDSDGDGIYDIVEVNNSNTSGDNDGMANTENVGDNGLHNDVEVNDTITTAINYTIPNTDNNGNANFIDIDSDDDGIVDHIEAQTTTGYIAPNGTVTEYGIDTAYEDEGLTPTDTDDDGDADYIDTNSDNDVRDDIIEGWDTDSDGIAEITALGSDSDSDGLDDAFDTDDTSVNPTNGQTPDSFPDVDNTDNPEKDWREIIAIVVIIDDISEEEGTDLIFNVSLVTKNSSSTNNPISVASTTDIIIDFSTSDGTVAFENAIAPYDYVQITTEIVTIPAFDETATFTVTSTDDIIFELDELFSLTGNITSENTVNTEVTGTGTLLNNDDAPEISVDNPIGDEGTDLTHIITLTHPSSTPIIININTEDDTATNSLDYTSVSETLTIEGTIDPNNANIETSFNTITLTDNTNELDEEVLGVLGTISSNNTSNNSFSGTGTIIDIDPNPFLNIEDVIVVEGNPLEFTFTLLNPDTEEEMFNYLPLSFTTQSSDETTTNGLDYQEVSNSITIPANTSSATQNIITIDDNLNESTETLFLSTRIGNLFSNDVNDLENTGSIKDNDIPNLFSPNGDGMSDVFAIAGIEDFPNFKLVIFDRWGSEIYNYNNNGSLNPTWWDGSFNGNPAPEGVYFYTLDFNDGETTPKKNFIQLVR